MTATTVTTLRDKARQSIRDSVAEAAAKSHEPNYYKLHVLRDGTVSWFESADRNSDIIDRQADGFAAVPNVYRTGTGSCACNCDHCNEVYSETDEALAHEQGRKYVRADKYATREEAITDAVGNSDLDEIEGAMLAALDRIPAGYFQDEEPLTQR